MIHNKTQFHTKSKLIERSIEHNGLSRWCLEYQPNSFPSSNTNNNNTTTISSSRKLVIVLHGGTESMRTIFRYSRRGTTFRWLTLSDQYGFLVLAPNAVNAQNNNDTKGNNQNWNDLREVFNPDIDDVGLITKLIN